MQRTSYFEGMQVSVHDATHSQIALASAIKNRITDYYTKGVIDGLTVYTDNTDFQHVVVGTGVAYDPDGERIYVPNIVRGIGYQDAPVNVGVNTFTVVARYVEGNDQTTGIEPDGTCHFRHVLDSYQIAVLKNTVDPLLANDIRLAGLYVSTPGGTFIFDVNTRDIAEAVLGGSGGSSSSGSSAGVTRYANSQTAIASQVLFNLPFSYQVGASSLDVYRNGIKQLIGAGNDYLETTSTSVTFNYALTVGDSVEFVINGVIPASPVQVHAATHQQGNTDPIFPVVTVHTSSGGYTATTTNDFVIVNKTVGETTVVTLPATPTTGARFIIKDGKGDSATNAITIQPASGTIDGATNYIVATNYAAINVVYNGSQYNIW